MKILKMTLPAELNSLVRRAKPCGEVVEVLLMTDHPRVDKQDGSQSHN